MIRVFFPILFLWAFQIDQRNQVHDRDHELDFFDQFGRPIRTEWERRPLSLNDDQLRLLYGPTEQASYASEILNLLSGERDETINIGVLDPEVKDNLVVRSKRKNSPFSFHDLEGKLALQIMKRKWGILPLASYN